MYWIATNSVCRAEQWSGILQDNTSTSVTAATLIMSWTGSTDPAAWYAGLHHQYQCVLLELLLPTLQ